MSDRPSSTTQSLFRCQPSPSLPLWTSPQSSNIQPVYSSLPSPQTRSAGGEPKLAKVHEDWQPHGRLILLKGRGFTKAPFNESGWAARILCLWKVCAFQLFLLPWPAFPASQGCQAKHPSSPTGWQDCPCSLAHREGALWGAGGAVW